MLTMVNGKVVEMRRNKYGNRHTEYRGQTYDSKKEAERAMELDSLVRQGKVTAWRRPTAFHVEHNGVKICKYIPDFQVTYPDGRTEYEDVKGMKTRVYRLKKKMMKAFFNIDIKEL